MKRPVESVKKILLVLSFTD